MKRSEAIAKIVSVMESFYHKKDDRFSILSDFILSELEKGGMLPPHAVIAGNKDEFEGHIQNCQWEEE